MSDPSRLHRPAGAYDDLLVRTSREAREQATWQPVDGAMPAIFVSHGAPPTLDDATWLEDLRAWARTMPKPRGIVVVSAHWEDAPLTISGIEAATPLHHDYGGFHPRYRTLTYDTPDATTLAHQVAGSLSDTTALHVWSGRGLDHGAFIPLMAMWPAADVPVVQLSMPSQEPAALLSLGARLRSLRSEGVLVVGSGFMTHGRGGWRDPERMPQIEAFDTWAADAAERGDVDALVDYRDRAPGVDVAHPTADHFVPLLLMVGAADDPATASTAFRRIALGNSTRSMQAD